jgi:hypothetical protein
MKAYFSHRGVRINCSNVSLFDENNILFHIGKNLHLIEARKIVAFPRQSEIISL